MAEQSVRDRVTEVLAAHNIECTGPGEVSCRGCRERGWISWATYRGHLADALAAAGLLAEDRDEAQRVLAETAAAAKVLTDAGEFGQALDVLASLPNPLR